MKEEWRDIKGYEGLYQVSNFGRVKSLNYARQHYEKEKALQTKPNGYVKVDLRHCGELSSRNVHRLVAEAFIPNPEGKTDVNHINGNKLDNRVENLEWCTRAENMLHCKEKLHKIAGKKPRPIICLETGVEYCTMHEAARSTGIPLSSISNNLRDQLKYAGGYHWKYL